MRRLCEYAEALCRRVAPDAAPGAFYVVLRSELPSGLFCGDMNGAGVVDGQDFAVLAGCLLGPMARRAAEPGTAYERLGSEPFAL